MNFIQISAFFMVTTAISPPATAQANPQPVRFRDKVFDEVRVQENSSYKTTIPAGTKKKYYLFDFYEPMADSSLRRPLIIWLHGGGFKFGKKTSAGTPVWSKAFAQRGYVCAAINYRLSKKHPLKNFADLVEGCSDAIEDLYSAVAFFKAHCLEYRIDTQRILLGGNSAGGMMALQAAYSSPAEMQQLIHKTAATPATTNQHNPMQIAAVINCWGALFAIDWLNNARVPLVSIHGRNDRVVPIDHTNTPLYGSLAIHHKADSLQLPNRLKIFEGYSHELQKHFNPLFAGGKTKKRWLEAGDFIANFLYEELFRNQ